jgi:hypothetical protein
MDREDRKVNEKIEKLRNWLRVHVVSPSTPQAITLSDFEFNTKDISGSFCLTLDNVKFISRFDFDVQMNGQYEIYPPLFVSPMGVPASYPSIELTDETKIMIEELLNNFFPKVKPLGIDRETGEFITRNTPMVKRLIDIDSLESIKEEVMEEGFQLKFEVKK